MNYQADKLSSDANLLKGLNRNISSGLRITSPFLSFLWDILLFLTSILSLPIRVLLRKNFGERTISGLSIILSFLWLYFSPFFNALYHNLDLLPNILYGTWPANRSLYLIIFYIFFIVIAIIAVVQSRQRRIKGQTKVYSYYRGDSILSNTTRQDRVNSLHKAKIWTFIEPIIIFILGYLIFTFLVNDIGFVLLTGSIALFIEEYGVLQKAKAIELDLIDGELESIHIEKLQEHIKLKFEQGAIQHDGKKIINIVKIPTDDEVIKYLDFQDQKQKMKFQKKTAKVY
jgi:hypothetical protein